MHRKLRIFLAALFFAGITLLFAGIGKGWWGWMAKLQFIPSCLALNVAVIAALVLLTLVCGRIYCSVICPLGVFQDIVAWTKKRICRKSRYSWSPEKKWLRLGVWVLFVASIAAGVQVIVSLLDPYSAYGRIVGSILHAHGWIVPTIAGVTLVAVALLAWMGGRTYCNTICPVGTTLSFLSRFAMFRPMMDSDKCVKCHACEKACKASCIDVEAGKIDYSRCVDCFDCIGSCKPGGIRYGFAWKKPSSSKDNGVPSGTSDSSRRAFLVGAALAAGSLSLKAEENKLDGGLAAIEAKKKPLRKGRLVPFGAGGEKSFYEKCTACQLCVSNCPNSVLRPSTDLDHLMQPEMSYEDGWCRPECTACSQVCPSGAISSITPEEKTAIHIGTAVVNLELCVSNEGVSCGNCAVHCPTSAIKMVSKVHGDPDSVKIPTVRENLCIGCGACEYLCPARPYSAIHVDGIKVHHDE